MYNALSTRLSVPPNPAAIFDGDVSTGAADDLQRATEIAVEMVTKYGMSEDIGPIALELHSARSITGQAMEQKEYSETVSTKIDGEVAKIMTESYKRALDIITTKRPVLDAIARALIAAETLEQPEYEQILIAHGIQLKKKDIISEVEAPSLKPDSALPESRTDSSSDSHVGPQAGGTIA